jgi:hypothetical protein
LSPLTNQDPLVQLFGAELPVALTSARPQGNPLGLADDFQLSPLETERGQESSTNAGADAYLRAAAEAEKERRASWREQLLDLVSVEGPGGIAYSLWFLIAAGMLLGLIVCVVGYSYYQSTKEIDVNRERSFESRE